jgi:predicted NAD-dependent protein-ADP-ribosyltransferase YbiA (DUF1768 family)
MPNIRAHKPITKNTMGFYDNKLQAGAFANTYAATSDIHYRNQKSRYAELLWQAEKLERYANDPQYRNFANALAYLEQQAKAKGLSTIPFFTRGITSVNPGEWDKISIELMSKIHAARFKAEPDLFLSLIYTPYDSVLIEDTSINGANADKRWGNGPDGKGLNLLGLLYMTHRERFWKAFKDKFGTKFNIDKAEDVAFLLEWLTNYTG